MYIYICGCYAWSVSVLVVVLADVNIDIGFISEICTYGILRIRGRMSLSVLEESCIRSLCRCFYWLWQWTLLWQVSYMGRVRVFPYSVNLFLNFLWFWNKYIYCTPHHTNTWRPTQQPNPSLNASAKQINILGSRQHPAEKVALWCELFFFFKSGQIAGYSYAYKYIFNGVWAI